jgi:hypothetical protein
MSYDQTARDYSPRDPYKNKAYEEIAPQSLRYGPAISGASQSAEGGVIRSVRRMEKQLMELSATVDALSERLSMVRISYPATQGGAEKSVEGSSLAAQLVAYNQALECQTARLQQLMQELDL